MNKTSVAKNFINFLGPNALTGIVSFIIIFPITTHYVTISEFGTRALVFLAVLLVSILTSYGAIWVIQAFYNDFDDKDRSIFITTLYLYGLFLLLAVSSIFYLYSDFLFNLIISWDSSYELYFQISLIRLILRRHESIMLECWTMDGLSSSFLKYRLVDLVAKLLSTYYFLVLEGFGLLGLFYVDITAALISSSFFPFFAKSYMSFNIGLEHLNSIIKIGYPAIPKSIIGQIDKNIISYFLIVFTSLELVGIFNRSNVMTKYYKHIIQALRRTVMPKFILSERKGKPFPVDQIVNSWYILSSFLIIASCFFVEYLLVLIGVQSDFLVISYYIPLLFLRQYVEGATIFISSFSVIHKKPKYILYPLFFRLFFTLTLAFMLIPKYGIQGGIVTLVCSSFLVLLYKHHLALKLGFKGSLNMPILFITIILILASHYVSFSLNSELLLKIITFPFILIFLLILDRYLNKSFIINFSKHFFVNANKFLGRPH